MNVKKPNLFTWATKELSQDAFICWLAAWANPDCFGNSKYMFESGTAFVHALLSKHNISNIEITKVEVERQLFGVIDVVIKVYTTNKNYLIIIEDKIHSSEHSNQLARYSSLARNSKHHQELELLCLFVKTGDQASYASAKKYGYSLFLRSDFLSLFKVIESFDGTNDILEDFKTNIISSENSINSFEKLSIQKWHWDSWKGFYMFLQKSINLTDWRYVANPTGGFLGAWWHFLTWKNFNVYLQIEQGNLCFKIGEVYKNDCNQGSVRNEWHSVVIKEAKKRGFSEIKRPNRFGSGTYMTIAIVERKDWLGSDDSILDKKQVIETLLKYEVFLTECVNSVLQKVE